MGFLDRFRPWYQRDRISPDFIAAPADVVPPVDEWRLAELDQALVEARDCEDWYRVDRLLDMRNAIRPPRPSVPVIPGRS
jgi:hypothetical protein